MFWTTLILFTMAIISWRFAQTHPDDVGQFLGIQSALFCLVAALVKAPLFLQGTILLGLIVYPTCSFKSDRSERFIKPHCPRFCLLRKRCRSRA